MSKQIEFEGQTHEFPDDFTDADIAKALGGGKAAAPTPTAPAEPESLLGYMERRTRPTEPTKTAFGNAWDQTVGRASRAFTEFGKDLIGGSAEAPLPGGSVVPEGLSRTMAAAANPIPETPVQAGAMAATAGAGPLVGLAAKTRIPVATLQAYPWLARVLGGAAGGELGGELSGETPGVGAAKGGGAALVGEAAAGGARAVANKTFPWTEAGRKAIASGDLARVGQTMSEVAPTLQPGTTSNAMQRTAEGQGLGRISAAKEQAVQQIEALMTHSTTTAPTIAMPSLGGKRMSLREANRALSDIGAQLDRPDQLGPNVNIGDLKRQYGAVANDIREGIYQNAGLRGTQIWDPAQANYEAARSGVLPLLMRKQLFKQNEFNISDLQSALRDPRIRAELADALGGNTKTGENFGDYNKMVNSITGGAGAGFVDRPAGKMPKLLEGGSYAGGRYPAAAARFFFPNYGANYIGTGRIPQAPAPSANIRSLVDAALQKVTP